MLNLKFIQENPEVVVEKLKKKNFDASEIVGQITGLYRQKNQLQNMADQAKSEMNALSREIGNLMREGKKTEAEAAKEKTSEIKESIKEYDRQFSEIEDKVNELLVLLPNLPHESVPFGKGAEDNEVVKKSGEIPELDEKALPTWELAQKYNLIDFELGEN
jgi:seryl-tRNA synthetase